MEEAVHTVTMSHLVPLPPLHFFPTPGRVRAPFPLDLIPGCPPRPGFWGPAEQSATDLGSPPPEYTEAAPMVSSPNRVHGLKLPSTARNRAVP